MRRQIQQTPKLQQHPVVHALKTAYQNIGSYFDLSHLNSTGMDAVIDSGTESQTNPETNPQTNKPKPQLWLACSGGRDSLGLALASQHLNHSVFQQLNVIHINHNLQQPSSQWAEHVAQFCHAHDLRFYCHSIQLADGSELTARNARFKHIFASMNDQDVLMLGHHADDQAETVLMNLFKGTGLAGLSAMSPWQQRVVEPKQKSVYLWRPWLGVSRASITDFCQQAQLDYIDDPTNKTGDNTRAYIRQQLMPVIQQHWSNATGSICRTATVLAEAKHTVDAQTQADLVWLGLYDLEKCQWHSHATIDIKALLSLPLARQHAVLAQWLKGDAVYTPARQIVQQIQQLASRKQAKATEIHWQHWQIKRYQQDLYKLPNPLSFATEMMLDLALDKTIDLPSGQWRVIPAQNTCYSLSTSWLNQPLVVRPKRVGERLHIAGRVGSWPLKKFFQTQKIPPWQRQQAHVLCASNNVYSKNTQTINAQDIKPLAIICHAGFFVLADVALENDVGWVLSV